MSNFNRLFSFRSFAAEVFMDLRKQKGVSNENYLASLDPDAVMATFSDKYSEGRSGSFFVFSPDKRFIIKTIEATEATLLRSILHKYHRVCTPLALGVELEVAKWLTEREGKESEREERGTRGSG